MRASLAAEKVGIPSVVITSSEFLSLAHHTAQGDGYDIRIAEYSGGGIMAHTDTQIDEEVKKHTLDQVIEGLTKPIQEIRAKAPELGAMEIAFKGTFEEVNEYFYKSGWTDGLPIIPPTIEKVEQFLKYTDRSPEEEIAVLRLANLRATPWNIAVNGVMAGCRPEYMPILIAAVQAIAEPAFKLKDIGNTGGCRPYLLINGPITKQLDIHSGTGLISPGARRLGASTAANPNSTIGRTLHLIVENIAGFRPAISEMSVFGHQQSFVLAEDGDECPWEPYHVDHGFDRDMSTVTAMAWMSMATVEPESRGDNAAPHLRWLGMQLAHVFHPQAFIWGGDLMVTVAISPPTAKAIARDGYSRRDVAEQIFQNSRMTVRHMNDRLVASSPYLPDYTIHSLAAAGTIPKSFDVGPDEMIPAVVSPDVIHIVVCGNPGRNRCMMLLSYYTNPVTKEIKLPTNWDEMRTKTKK